MVKNKQQGWFSYFLNWWFSGAILLYTELLVKPLKRYKNPSEQPETTFARFRRGGMHALMGIAWLSLVPLCGYLVAGFIYQGAILLGLTGACYLYFVHKSSATSAAAVGIVLAGLTTYTVLQALSIITAPFAFIFGIKGMLELGYGFFELSIGTCTTSYDWLIDYQDCPTGQRELQRNQNSETLKNAANRLSTPAKDAQQVQLNQASKSCGKIDNSICKIEKHMATLSLLKWFGLGIPKVNVPSLAPTNWGGIAKDAKAYTKLFTNVTAEAGTQVGETKMNLTRVDPTGPGVHKK